MRTQSRESVPGYHQSRKRGYLAPGGRVPDERLGSVATLSERHRRGVTEEASDRNKSVQNAGVDVNEAVNLGAG